MNPKNTTMWRWFATIVAILACSSVSAQPVYNAALNGDYGYWIGPRTDNATLYTLQRPAIVSPLPTFDLPYTAYARINPTYSMAPSGNLSFGGGLPNVVARKVVVPWPYCMTAPWRVITPDSLELVASQISAVPGFQLVNGSFVNIGFTGYAGTFPECAGGLLVYGEEPVDFGMRSGQCNRGLANGPLCNETNVRTPFSCSLSACRDPLGLTGQAYEKLSQTETGPVSGDILPIDVGSPSQFKGTITYYIPDTCPHPVLLGIDGSSPSSIDVAPLKVIQDGGQSAVFVQPAPSCAPGTRPGNANIYDPNVRAIPMCDQYVPVLPDYVVNRTVANASERAEWRRLNGFSGTETGPDNLRGFGRRVFMVVADSLPDPITVRVSVRWVGSAIHGFPNVTQPDVFVGFQRTVYVASPPWNDGFAYGLELTWFDAAPESRRGRQAFYPGIQRGNLPVCLCNSSTVQGNLICTNGTQLDLAGNGLRRDEVSLVYNTAGISTAIRNTVVCGLVYGSFGTGFLSVASGVTFWAAGVGSSSSFGAVGYAWTLMDVPTAGGQLFSSTGFNITGVVTSISTFRLRVTVTDTLFFSTTCMVTITPISAIPIPRLTPTEATILPGTFLLLDASASSTPAGDSLQFSWSIIFPPSGTGVLTGDVTSGAVFFSSPANGKFVVQVIVSNSFGDKAALAYITVTNDTTASGPGSGSLPPSYGGDNGCFAQLPPVSFAFPPGSGNELPPFSPGGGGGGSPTVAPVPQAPAPEALPLIPGIPDEAFAAIVTIAMIIIGILAVYTLWPSFRGNKRRTD